MTAVHISKMTGKLDGFRAISTNTVTNAFCQKMNTSGDTICRLCYSHEMLKSYRKNMQPSLQRNSDSAIRPRAGSNGIADNPRCFLPYQRSW
jgi:hypothetical protein